MATNNSWNTPALLTNGQLLIGDTSTGFPLAATLTQGTGITITNGAGSITIAATSSTTAWVNQTSSTVTIAANTGYIINDSTNLVTLTLPATIAQGSIVEIAGMSSGGWKLAQASGQQINFGAVATTSGTGGSLASSNTYDSIRLVCTTANTQFTVLSSMGNITYV
jgi:hypothetical protein